MSADGTDQTNLTNTPLGDDVGPTWSPTGTRLAFDSTRTDDREIFVMNADGTAQLNLTESGGLDADPDWSPDGSRLLFVSAHTGPTSVWSMNADGTDPVDITGSGNFDADPAWSPDGNHIVFTREITGGLTFNLWTARADGTAQLPITGAVSTQRNSFADWGSRASETVVTLEPVADTYVARKRRGDGPRRGDHVRRLRRREHLLRPRAWAFVRTASLRPLVASGRRAGERRQAGADGSRRLRAGRRSVPLRHSTEQQRLGRVGQLEHAAG